jgi:hypothetical protein
MPRGKSSGQHRQDILDVFNLLFPMLDYGQKRTTEANKAYDILVEYTSTDYMTRLTDLIPGPAGRLVRRHRSTPARPRRKTVPPNPKDLENSVYIKKRSTRRA